MHNEEDRTPAVIDRRRFRRVRNFFARAFIVIFWHDFVLRTVPGLRLLRSDPIPRWVALAQRYRALAVELGGVLIKLGQFLSIRVDILPLEVTRELSGLQDEVPPSDFSAVVEQLESEFGRPLDAIFDHLEPEPLGAASLAQVHAARLPDGREVVVKVLRPGIDVLVETDLKAIGMAIRWLEAWAFVRKRIDLEWVEEEFGATTRRELDLRLEGRNAEHFTELFANDDDVYLPSIEWEYTTQRTLTEENVGYININDLEALDAAGIRPDKVARTLYQVYMRQVFVHHFLHADPHPGNLFVKPLDVDPDAKPEEGRPFQIVFVDFGMVAVIPPRLRSALRRLVIGLGSRDASEVIQAVRDAGYLLPGADLLQLEEAVDAIFERFWGVEMGRLNKLAQNEAGTLWKEFGQLLLETPVQVQVDMMFTGRALEILGGLATYLDKDFNPWQEIVPFAERLARESVTRNLGAQATELFEQARQLAKLPSNVARVANLAQRGRLMVRTGLAPDARKELARLGRRVDRLGDMVFAVGALVAGAILMGDQPGLGIGLMVAGTLWALVTKLR